MIKRLTIAALTASFLLGVVLPAAAQTTTTPTTTTKKTLNVACIQDAVDKRDTAIASAVTTFSTTVTNGLNTRKDALKAAWALTDTKARRAALNAAWTAWRTTARQARHTLNTARTSAWTQFRTDRRNCGSSAATGDTTSVTTSGDTNL